MTKTVTDEIRDAVAGGYGFVLSDKKAHELLAEIDSKLPDFMRREVDRAIEEALHPKGMSTHDGKAKVSVSTLQRLLALHSPAELTAPSIINAEGSLVMMELFNRMPAAALNAVPEEIAKRVGDFMVANGYRCVFDRWHLQAEPKEPERSAVNRAVEPSPPLCCQRSGVCRSQVACVAEGRCLAQNQPSQSPPLDTTMTWEELP